MRVFATSDVHVDHPDNRGWLFNLSDYDYRHDVLILAGDMTDDLRLLESALQVVAAKFRQVLFVPGNHELWVVRDESKDSLKKFAQVLGICRDCGVSTDVYRSNGLSIVPLFGWYDFSFGAPCAKILQQWADFAACVWPEGFNAAMVTELFLQKNLDRLVVRNETVISFSHFLPDIGLMPDFVHPSKHYIYPVLGAHRLGEQVRALQPAIHVYGHSHVNNDVSAGGIRYINNAYGYPSETRITSKQLLCIYQH